MSLATSGAGWPGLASATSSAATFPDDDKTILHVVNRIAFGPRPGKEGEPGDVVKIREMGLQRYIDQQLHPDRIPDPDMGARLAGLETIGMSSREIVERFELPQLEARRERREQQSVAGEKAIRRQRVPNDVQQKANRVVIELSEQKLLRAIYSERQLQEVLTDFWFNHFNVDARKGRDRFMLTEYERDAIRPHVLGTVPRPARSDGQEPGDALLSRQLDERRSQRPARRMSQRSLGAGQVRRGRSGGGGPDSVPPTARAPNSEQATERAAGAERELRTRADGAAHARRRRRLHAEGRDRGGARVHRLDD